MGGRVPIAKSAPEEQAAAALFDVSIASDAKAAGV